MSESNEKSKSTLGTILLAIGLILTTVANIAGIMQLKDAPIMAIVIVLTAAAIVLALYALSERKHKKTAAAWLAAGAMLCATFALGATLFSLFGKETGAFKRPDISVNTDTTTREDKGSDASQPSNNSRSSDMPSSVVPKSAPPLLDREMTFWLNTGADLDVSDPKVGQAQAAAGSIDIALKYYGSLDAGGKGFYKPEISDDLEQACRDALGSARPTEKEAFAIAGKEYCIRTSSGNIASVQIVEFASAAMQPGDSYAKLAIKVWPK